MPAGRPQRRKNTKIIYKEQAMKNNYTERAAALFFRFKDSMHRLKPPGSGNLFTVLGGLAEFEARFKRPVTISEIARFSGLAISNVSRLLRPFEEKGLIQKVKSGRTVSVAVTREGHRVLDGFNRNFMQDIALALSALSEDECESFISCGEKMMNKLDELKTSREKADV